MSGANPDWSPAIADWYSPDEEPPPPPMGTRRPLRVRLEVDDAIEAAALVALLRHRFRL